MNINNVAILDYENAISDRTHPQPENDSRFYKKYKDELSLSNPLARYRKYRRVLDSCKKEF